MEKLNFKNKWVLITGASSGLGKAIALYMSKHEGANLVITARRKEQLENLKNEIESSCDRKVETIQGDLGIKEDVERIFKESTELADIFAVINNAGATYYGVTDYDHIDTFEKIIDVNLKACMVLTLRFLDLFKKKGEGAILNITSEAGLMITPFQTAYSASKHAIQAFTEAVYMENKGSGITISSFAPGGIATEMLTKSGLDKKHGLDSPFNMDVNKAARLAVKSFKKKKFLTVPGIMNKLTVVLARLFSRKLVGNLSAQIYKLP